MKTLTQITLCLFLCLLSFSVTSQKSKIRSITNADTTKVAGEVSPNGIINVLLDVALPSEELSLSINGEQFGKLIESFEEGKLLQFKLEKNTTPDLWEEKFSEGEFLKKMNVRVVSEDNTYKTTNSVNFTFVKMRKSEIISISDGDGKPLNFNKEFKIQLSNLNFDPPFQASDELILYINGRPFSNIVGELNREDKAVFFRLIMERDTTKPDPWKRLVSSAKSNESPVEFAVGVENGGSTKGMKADMKLFNLDKNMGGVIYLAVLLILFIVSVAVLDSWLKQDVAGAAAYSYSKMQFLYWNVIVLGAYTYLFLQTWTLFPLSVSTLALITFSSVTTLAARLQDNAGSAASSKVVTSNQVYALFSDGSGLSLPRLQSLFFNLIFGIYFVYIVFTKLSLVEFNYTQLAMIGISSGTYAALKTIEK